MFNKFLGIVGAAIIISAPVSAATVGFTEGKRDLVLGTTAVAGTDASSNPNGFDLGTVGDGGGEFTNIDVHGRIVSAADTFNFFSSGRFIVEFIFGDMDNGGSVAGGFVDEDGVGAGNSSDFIITFGTGGSDSKIFSTDILSEADNGNTSLIFSGFSTGVNPHIFQIDNRGTNPSQAARYDIRISTIPLPATGILLLGAFGCLSFASRRKKS